MHQTVLIGFLLDQIDDSVATVAKCHFIIIKTKGENGQIDLLEVFITSVRILAVRSYFGRQADPNSSGPGSIPARPNDHDGDHERDRQCR